MTIEHISDTARWVAFYRAMESERPDALFVDPWARTLAGAKGEQIVRELPRAQSSAWAMIVRTALFDELILRLLGEQPVDMVINLAAGLDTRPYRLELPPSLHWVDVDLPAILEYKAGVLAHETPRCRYESVATDLAQVDARRALFSRLGAESRRALILTEGLLVYLQPEQVAALADDLSAQPSFGGWIIDIASPWLRRYMQKSWGKTLESGGSTMHFFPENGTRFFASHGWHEAEYHSTVEEARRLHREMHLAWIGRVMGLFASPARRETWRKISGVVLLERSR